jgi:hypothetical protein
MNNSHLGYKLQLHIFLLISHPQKTNLLIESTALNSTILIQ